jgi:acyl-coenzyme A synthetase/AMP-(fatty) acid ligase
MAASFISWFAVKEGSCVIIPSTFPQPISEIQYLLNEHDLSNVCLFPPFLSAIIRQARNDPSLLASLKKADSVGSGGLDPDPADVAWGRSKGLHMPNILGSTELGMPMASDGRENNDYLLPLPGNKHEFIPIGDSLATGEPLLELVSLPDSPDCPVPSLRAADGKFHTGDLFIEPSPGKYLCKGRNDNWIKMQSALRCDTSSIEFNVMDTCGNDLVNAVVVVGVGRPCPTIIVEPKDKSVVDSKGIDQRELVGKLKREILERIAPFHKRRYEHERVNDTRYIVVVPQGSLPRTITKGNVRRKEVEKLYEAMLDTLYVK